MRGTNNMKCVSRLACEQAHIYSPWASAESRKNHVRAIERRENDKKVTSRHVTGSLARDSRGLSPLAHGTWACSQASQDRSRRQSVTLYRAILEANAAPTVSSCWSLLRRQLIVKVYRGVRWLSLNMAEWPVLWLMAQQNCKRKEKKNSTKLENSTTPREI